MDARETKEAGNALVGWFNSQGLKPDEALLVMRKVIAKIILKPGMTEREVHHIVTALSVDLIHDVLERRDNGR